MKYLKSSSKWLALAFLAAMVGDIFFSRDSITREVFTRVASAPCGLAQWRNRWVLDRHQSSPEVVRLNAALARAAEIDWQLAAIEREFRPDLFISSAVQRVRSVEADFEQFTKECRRYGPIEAEFEARYQQAIAEESDTTSLLQERRAALRGVRFHNRLSSCSETKDVEAFGGPKYITDKARIEAESDAARQKQTRSKPLLKELEELDVQSVRQTASDNIPTVWTGPKYCQ
ncbi:hypothetical protein [uncultured Tateyamaria sp.]|uniref:hypothetical protein n=1 Tax=uncultured Tateyamaria sp. TaxID=455651 RepID=UPI00263459B8|nr:hypothetical protein [uncultured Tateyamaria sp.]